ATWVPVGSVLMFNLAPVLGLNYGWQSVWWFGAGFALAAFVFYLLLIRRLPTAAGEVTTAAPANPDRAIANPNIWLLGLCFCCFNLIILALTSFLPR
ncbi:MAG: hypothetical protein ACK2U9_22010, partial [Anaerolineae bacterium]